MGLILSTLPLVLYLFAGVSIGCLTAPAEFLRSPAGEVWMDLIGTRSVAVARVACAAGVVASFATMYWVADMILTMAPFV